MTNPAFQSINHFSQMDEKSTTASLSLFYFLGHKKEWWSPYFCKLVVTHSVNLYYITPNIFWNKNYQWEFKIWSVCSYLQLFLLCIRLFAPLPPHVWRRESKWSRSLCSDHHKARDACALRHLFAARTQELGFFQDFTIFTIFLSFETGFCPQIWNLSTFVNYFLSILSITENEKSVLSLLIFYKKLRIWVIKGGTLPTFVLICNYPGLPRRGRRSNLPQGLSAWG